MQSRILLVAVALLCAFGCHTALGDNGIGYVSCGDDVLPDQQGQLTSQGQTPDSLLNELLCTLQQVLTGEISPEAGLDQLATLAEQAALLGDSSVEAFFQDYANLIRSYLDNEIDDMGLLNGLLDLLDRVMADIESGNESIDSIVNDLISLLNQFLAGSISEGQALEGLIAILEQLAGLDPMITAFAEQAAALLEQYRQGLLSELDCMAELTNLLTQAIDQLATLPGPSNPNSRAAILASGLFMANPSIQQNLFVGGFSDGTLLCVDMQGQIVYQGNGFGEVTALACGFSNERACSYLFVGATANGGTLHVLDPGNGFSTVTSISGLQEISHILFLGDRYLYTACSDGTLRRFTCPDLEERAVRAGLREITAMTPVRNRQSEFLAVTSQDQFGGLRFLDVETLNDQFSCQFDWNRAYALSAGDADFDGDDELVVASDLAGGTLHVLGGPDFRTELVTVDNVGPVWDLAYGVMDDGRPCIAMSSPQEDGSLYTLQVDLQNQTMTPTAHVPGLGTIPHLSMQDSEADHAPSITTLVQSQEMLTGAVLDKDLNPMDGFYEVPGPQAPSDPGTGDTAQAQWGVWLTASSLGGCGAHCRINGVEVSTSRLPCQGPPAWGDGAQVIWEQSKYWCDSTRAWPVAGGVEDPGGWVLFPSGTELEVVSDTGHLGMGSQIMIINPHTGQKHYLFQLPATPGTSGPGRVTKYIP